MFSNGIDLVEIERIEKAMENPRFIERFFSAEEQQLFMQRGYSANVVAANFAGKEAFSKAIGLGVRGFSLNEVSILRNELGAPYFKLEGRAKELAKNMELAISITHTDTLACAMVTGMIKE